MSLTLSRESTWSTLCKKTHTHTVSVSEELATVSLSLSVFTSVHNISENVSTFMSGLSVSFCRLDFWKILLTILFHAYLIWADGAVGQEFVISVSPSPTLHGAGLWIIGQGKSLTHNRAACEICSWTWMSKVSSPTGSHTCPLHRAWSRSVGRRRKWPVHYVSQTWRPQKCT